MHVDGSDKTPIFTHTNLIRAINDPSVSGDGEKIIFEGRISEGSEKRRYNLFMVGLDGNNLVRITFDDGESDIWPSFSPDGMYILYFTYNWDMDGGHTQKIRILRSDGSDEREISSFQWESFPSWFKK